ncbi:hypothetical protein PND92_11415 [Faecalicoccus pleomorphus]|uniref:hypothetical protein n=1 Tax=Faecalicoccus pleomorphus TaxID=1323 RepID=UPI00232F1E4D|nr:hypothetical protein [Faecalicoccus pleomorphus]MDB7994362.1 hypothetical protein [Faecalicoccus pleomorphus]
MNYLDNENNIIQMLQRVPTSEIWLMTDGDLEKEIMESLLLESKFIKWHYSAGKADPPPDYYNDSLHVMMDVMRVDDHSHLSDKGKLINPTNIKESKVQNELKKSDILNLFPNTQNIVVNAITDLPTNEDHNYNFYLSSFSRVINKHLKSIPIYKENHPNYKTIFLVLDESSGYVQCENEDKKRALIENQNGEARVHNCFLDFDFIQTLKDSDLDYLIWFCPYKWWSNNKVDLPRVSVLSVSRINLIEPYLQKYDSNLMVSTER